MSAAIDFDPSIIFGPHPAAPRPRAKPPGFFTAYRAMRDNPITALSERAFEQPYVRLSRPGGVLLLSEPAAIEHVLVSNAANYRKSRQQQRRLQPALGEGLLTAESDVWRSTRRITAPLFSPTAIADVYADMEAAAADMRDRWLEQCWQPTPMDLADEFQRLAYDIVSRTFFSGAVDRDRMLLHAGMAVYFDTLGRVDLATMLNLPTWLPSPDRFRARKAVALFRSTVDAAVRDRVRGTDGETEDLLDRMITAVDPKTGRGLDTNAVADNVLTFLAAGHETTGNALAWIFYLLALHPEDEDEVRIEIARAFDGAPVDRDGLDKLVYTKAVINEALRLYPPAPFIGREAIEEDRFAGTHVRKGGQILISPWVVHRHKALWHEPDEFSPVRFLGDAASRIQRGAFLPFGLGPRICIGQRFAMQEILTVLATVLPAIRYSLSDPQSVFPQARITLAPRNGLQAFVRPATR